MNIQIGDLIYLPADKENYDHKIWGVVVNTEGQEENTKRAFVFWFDNGTITEEPAIWLIKEQ